MKHYILLAIGFTPPTPEIFESWGKWYKLIGEHIVDSGNPFSPGKEFSHDGNKELPHDLDALTGYTIIKAKDMAAAQKIAETCPIITSMRVYELMLK